MLLIAILFAFLLATGEAHALPWPGGPPADVTPSGYGNNVSGAVWNPLTATLWTTENSPGIVRTAVYDSRDAQWVVTQSWQPGGDLEAIALRMYDDSSVYVGVERDATDRRVIREYAVPAFTLLREWHLAAMQFGPANDGLEALTFVPDSILTAMHFVDANGALYDSSHFDTGGLFFAGHQDTGEIFVFDLDRAGTGTNRPNVHVRTIGTGQSEIAGLEFDRDNGLLYAWHDASINKLQVFGADGAGHFTSRALFDNPFCCDWNIEGLAIVDRCEAGKRSLLFTRDQALTSDPSLYQDGAFPCDCNGNAVSDAIDIASGSSLDVDLDGVPDECEPVPSSTPGEDVAAARSVLHDNVPNPFNPETRIAFELPRAGRVAIAVFDLAGRRVRTLVDEIVQPGRHEARWSGTDANGRPVASGVYFCRMESDAGVEIKRMVRIR